MSYSARGVAAIAAALVVAAICVRLGFWQLDRLEQRRERNAALRSALALPPLHLRDSLPALFRSPDRYINRRVVMRGTYDPPGEIILRGRASAGRPGAHLVTPLRIAPDTAVLVDRGWVPAPDAATVDPRPLAERGLRLVEGILLAAPTTRDVAPAPIEAGGARFRSYSRIPLDTLRAAAPYRLAPLYVQQLAGSPPEGAFPRRATLPEVSEGSHRGYAAQWFGFAAIAVVGAALLWWRSRSGRA